MEGACREQSRKQRGDRDHGFRSTSSAIGKNLRAIAALAAAQAAAVKQLLDEQVKSDKDLGKRLVEAYDRLDRRITKELSRRGRR